MSWCGDTQHAQVIWSRYRWVRLGGNSPLSVCFPSCVWGTHGRSSSRPGSLCWLVTGWRLNSGVVRVPGQALSGPWPECRLGVRLCEHWGWQGAWRSHWLRHVMHWCWGNGYFRVLGLYITTIRCGGHSEWMPSWHCHCRAGRYISGVALWCCPGVGIWHNARRWRNPCIWGFLWRWSSCISNGHNTGHSLCRAWELWISPMFGFVRVPG